VVRCRVELRYARRQLYNGCDRAIPNQNLLIKSFAYKIKCLLKNIVLLYSTGSHANALDAGL